MVLSDRRRIICHVRKRRHQGGACRSECGGEGDKPDATTPPPAGTEDGPRLSWAPALCRMEPPACMDRCGLFVNVWHELDVSLQDYDNVSKLADRIACGGTVVPTI